MIERTRRRFDLSPVRLAVDTAYGRSISGLRRWRRHHSARPVDDGTFSRSDFRFDRGRNVYICPAGQTAANKSSGS
jgi:hypothetical protein